MTHPGYMLYALNEDGQVLRENKLPPEIETGNIEYKVDIISHFQLRLVDPPPDRVGHLSTQLKWRLTESGECFYYIGVDDDGTIIGLDDIECEKALDCINQMCLIVQAKIIKFDRLKISECEKRVLFIHLGSDSQSRRNCIKIGLVGESESGKSTLCGVIAKGSADDGQGSARLSLIRHRHEILAGRSSTVTCENVSFDSSGLPLNPAHPECGQDSSWFKESLQSKEKIFIDFIDFAGHSRSLKTTLSALSLHQCDLFAIIIDARKNLSLESLIFIDLIISLCAPFSVVINKLDLVSAEQLTNLMQQIVSSLESKGKNVKLFDLNIQFDPDTVPIFAVSCRSLQFLSNLCKFFTSVPSRPVKRRQNYPEIIVEDWFDLPEIGCILIALINSGSINFQASHQWLIGPDSNGKMSKIDILSVHSNHRPVTVAFAGQRIALAIGQENSERGVRIRKGMSLVLEKHGTPLTSSIRLPFIEINSECICFIKGTKQNCSLKREGNELILSTSIYPIVNYNLDRVILLHDGKITVVNLPTNQ